MAEEESNLIPQIIKLSLRIGIKIPFLDGEEKQDLIAASIYLSQALQLASDSNTEKDARRIFGIAKRMIR